MNFSQLLTHWLKKKKDEPGFRYHKINPYKSRKIVEPRSRVGVTRKDKKLSKKRRKMAKESRRINRRG